MHIPTIEEIIKVMKKKGHAVFEKFNRDYNLNIAYIRTADTESNKFNDLRVTFWAIAEGKFSVLYHKVTTDPGLYYRKDPINVKGTAIVPEGQYRGAWTVGMHQGKYPALVQKTEIPVIRDVDRDKYLDFDGEIDLGFHGINHHRASSTGTSTNVDKWSAGCFVAANHKDHDIFMELCKESEKIFGPGLTITVLHENDF